MISIIIVNYRTPYHVITCIESIQKYSHNALYEIILVDNASPDDSYKVLHNFVKKNKNINLISSSRNLGFGGGYNRGIKEAKGDYLLLLEPDIILFENSLQYLLKEYQTLSKKNKIGFIQPRLYLDNSKTRVQQTCSRIPNLMQIAQQNFRFLQLYKYNNWSECRYLDWDRNSSKKVEAVCAAAMFCSKKFFNEIGGFDERFFIYFEEFDLAQRIKKLGYANYFTIATSLIHLHDITPLSWTYKKWLYLHSLITYVRTHHSS